MARDWKEWAEHIFSEIKRAAQNIDTLDDRVTENESDLKLMKWQVRILMGLMIPILIAAIKDFIGG